jgi:CCR4-NOT transcription complex subunit 4
MSRAQQDQFVDDDEEEVCPLCVEEFDLSDKNFRPCPCGYQVRILENAIRPAPAGLSSLTVYGSRYVSSATTTSRRP